jgi:2-polyprenyl-3-methyl-5-hydroxy-6-metoxy-1,4-benzoquinol methylase
LVAAADAYHCSAGHAFPIVRGIPRFVPSDPYAESFGRQWNRFLRTQLDSHTGLGISEERVLRSMGLAGPSSGGIPQLRGQTVLEVGCGAGRFTEILLKHGAVVVSVDLSSAIEANAANFPPGPDHRVAQADVRTLPFGRCQFDGVFCLGVVQHTPDPEETIAALYEQVRPGGWLAIDHYAISPSSWTWLGVHAARQVVRRLPLERRLPTVERIVDRLLPVHAAVARRGRGAAQLLSRLSPVLSYYHIYPQLSDQLQREWAVLDTHDALTDTYKHHRRPREIRSHLNKLGLTDIVVRNAGNGIEARGRRPVASDGH